MFVILKLWDVLNITLYGKEIRLKKSDANCFKSVDDPQLVCIEQFVSWLGCWNQYTIQMMLFLD